MSEDDEVRSVTAPTRRELSRWLLRQARPVLTPLVISIAMRTLMLLAGAAILGVAAHGIVVASSTAEWSVSALVITLAVLSLIKAVARYLEQYSGHLVAFKALALLRTYFYDRLEPQAPAAVMGRRTGDLLSRATRDVDRVEVFFAHTLAPVVTALVVPLAVAGWIAVTKDLALAVVALVFWALIGAAVPLLGSASALQAARRLRVVRGQIAQHITDSVQGVREVLAFGYGPRRRGEWAEVGALAAQEEKVLGRWVAVRRGLNGALVAAAAVVVLLVGSSRVRSGLLEWGDLVIVLAVVVGTMPAVLAVEECVADLDQAFASAARIAEITEAAPATTEPAVPASPPEGLSEVRFESVSFAYPARDPADGPGPVVLRDVSLVLEPGTVTALVGVSGSGKSTLASLLARFWDPDKGSVSIGGVDLRDLADEDLRRLVSVVSQRPYLFNDTIEANLRIARPEATREELEEACRVAALTGTIAGLPDGLQTRVGELGQQLSGGQRQRVAIAQALLRDAPVLILDEVTSQLDVRTEAELTGALTALAHNRTTLVIAHRLATVREADRVVRLDGGRIAEQDNDQSPGTRAT